MQNAARDEAKKFKETFTPLEGRDYRWVIEHGKRQYELLSSAFDTLDAKADKLMQYLGGGTGLFAIAAVGLSSESTLLAFAAALPSMILALVAMTMCAAARRPRRVSLPPSVEGAVAYVDQFQRDQESYFLGQLHMTCEECRLAVESKSQLVGRAYACFCLGMWALLLPVGVAIARC